MVELAEQIKSIRSSLPVTLMLERRMIKRGLWEVPSWYLYGVTVGDSVVHESDSGKKLHNSDHGEVYSWTGYRVNFYKDACERYWHALIGEKPQVYVVCREDSDDDELDLSVEPLLVTCDYDEAIAHAETDELVLSTGITADLYRYMEAFVLHHYKPKPFQKRKRKKWSDQANGGQHAPARRDSRA